MTTRKRRYKTTRRRGSYRSLFADKRAQRRKKRVLRLALFSLLVVLLMGILGAYWVLFAPAGREDREYNLYITERSSLKTVEQELTDSLQLRHPVLFSWVSKTIGLQKKLKPGRYLLHTRMSIRELILPLWRGTQTPVRLVFNSARTQDELLATLTAPLQMDLSDLKKLLSDSLFCAGKGLDTASIRTIFLPNTYEVYWNTTPENLVELFYTHHQKFWTQERLQQARKIGLSPVEVSIIASIVEEESSKTDEYASIAGLYINRLRRGMRLQADPTVKYACGDFSIKRITSNLLAVSSPYNTYRVYGLPPAPIRYPQQSSIDKVLHFTEHEFLYMCARADFSGYHDFAKTYAEHRINAMRYQSELNKRNIR